VSRPRRLVALTLALGIGAAAFLLNPGWFRLLGGLPWLAATAGFLVLGLLAVLRAGVWERPGVPVWWSVCALSYGLFGLLLPDFGDVGPAYAFFGLWHHEAAEALLPFALAAAGVHLVGLVGLGALVMRKPRP